MTIFGLNSPEIFVILIILLFILGPKRIEKLLTSFPGFIKFLLNDEKNYEVTREEKEEEAPVLEEKEAEAPVLEEKEVEISKNSDKSTKTMKGTPINLEGEKKVKRKRSVKTKEKTTKKEKTPKPNKKTQINKEKDPDNIK